MGAPGPDSVPGGAPDGALDESEASLVAACAEGDPRAWDRFVRRFGALVKALARRMLAGRTRDRPTGARGGGADEADVDDVAGAVFLALLRRDRLLLRRYRPEFRLSTYLGVICRTEVSRLVRRKTPLRSLSEPMAGAGAEGDPWPLLPADPRAVSPLRALLDAERRLTLGQVRSALERLPPRDRLLLTLRFFEDLDYGQIAAVLRIGRDSVGQLLHRAKARLAAELPHLPAWLAQDEGSHADGA